jgi:peptide/nickel transport system ATP-binding protein
LDIEKLEVGYASKGGYVRAVDKISLHVTKGEAFGLAGESGCGKTTAALSIMKLLPPGGKILGGRILFDNQDLAGLSELELRKIRWKSISMVFQGAMNALNPVHKVGSQITEALLLHEKITRSKALHRAKDLLQMVGLDASRGNDYPHQFSGGMKQRAIIAMALACNPRLVIADEPVTALDVIVQDQILKLMKRLQEELGLSMILISHDLSVIAQTCDSVAIMYAGKIVEYADVISIFERPAHPYTQALVNAFPSVRSSRKLTAIPGSPPDLTRLPSGCRFHPRCPMKFDLCTREEPMLLRVEGGHYAACHLLQKNEGVISVERNAG